MEHQLRENNAAVHRPVRLPPASPRGERRPPPVPQPEPTAGPRLSRSGRPPPGRGRRGRHGHGPQRGGRPVRRRPGGPGGRPVRRSGAAGRRRSGHCEHARVANDGGGDGGYGRRSAGVVDGAAGVEVSVGGVPGDSGHSADQFAAGARVPRDGGEGVRVLCEASEEDGVSEVVRDVEDASGDVAKARREYAGCGGGGGGGGGGDGGGGRSQKQASRMGRMERRLHRISSEHALQTAGGRLHPGSIQRRLPHGGRYLLHHANIATHSPCQTHGLLLRKTHRYFLGLGKLSLPCLRLV
mmetsp:Transcript_35421/g.82151  ORF Transcript_35421/g.82151 Transcript_35421/m.82151 type:complete len:297 (-) Transcript_35421:1776-2666(-)